MNIIQREVALSTNAFLKQMRRMQPRQFDVEAFNTYCSQYVSELAKVFSKANPGLNIGEFMVLCLKGVE